MNPDSSVSTDKASVEMPRPTVAPLVLSLGISLLLAGMATSPAFLGVGGVLFVVGLGMWISQLLPGRGHCHEPLVEPALRPRAVIAAPGAVERMRQGMPGYRLRLPGKVHPLSAGIKGGLLGGLIMPLPALAYGILSGHGVWYPINLLAGMALPGVDQLSVQQLEQFRPALLAFSTGIHVTISLILGLLYGVLLPALPEIPKPFAWGALLMPVLWTAVSFAALGVVNPTAPRRVDWPWFIVSQFIFGMVAAIVFLRYKRNGAISAGLLGGIAGGLLMPAPAVLWGLLTHHGIWYPVNLLSAMIMRHSEQVTVAQLEQYHLDWLVAGVVMHAILSLGFGLAFGIVLPRMPTIPEALAWGGLVMPLLWMASSFGLMGVMNPVLQQRIDWPWFLVSQFIFGVVASIVVVRSEQVHIPPAGRGPDPFRNSSADNSRNCRGQPSRQNARRTAPPSGDTLSDRLAVAGHGLRLPGRPDPKDRPVPDDQVLSFEPLYRQNCAGCHGADGQFGPAPPLNDPLFLAIVSDAELERAICDGRSGTPMPAFSPQRGGSLTAAQIKALAAGIKRHWKPAAETPDSLPAYAASENDGSKTSVDDRQRGADVFSRACAECHGAAGDGAKGEGMYGAIHEPAFLSLISNQALRRVIITGRPDLGMPSYAEKEGRPADFQPLTAAQIDDLVSLLASWRTSSEGTVAADGP